MNLANTEELSKARCYEAVGKPVTDGKGHVIGKIIAARWDYEDGKMMVDTELTEEGMKLVEDQMKVGLRKLYSLGGDISDDELQPYRDLLI